MVDKMESYWDGENWLDIIESEFAIKYYLGHNLHRRDGPAEIIYFNNGITYLEKYIINGKLHREGSPAAIFYYDNGNIETELYYNNNKHHRIDGPSVIFYYENGIIKKEIYFFDGIKINLKKLPFDLPIDTEEKRLYINLKYGE